MELRKGGALALVWVQTLEKAFSNNQLTPLQLETPKTRMMKEEEKKKKDNHYCPNSAQVTPNKYPSIAQVSPNCTPTRNHQRQKKQEPKNPLNDTYKLDRLLDRF